jgi:hypothetical protein
LLCCPCPQRHLAVNQTLWPGHLEALVWISRAKSDRSKNALLQIHGERIALGDQDRQTAEIQIRIALMSRFNTLGTAEIKRVA